MQKKSYAQALSNVSNTTREILKIKEAFSSLQNKKIEQVQKIISGESKPKLCINITSKRPSYKQVIVSMSIDNAKNFVKDLSAHIVNINRSFKNISIVISTNKAASPLNLQSIEKYIKNTHCIETEHTESPRLP